MLFKIIDKGYQQTISKIIVIMGPAPFSAKKVTLILKPNYSGGIFFKIGNQTIKVCPENIKMQNISHTSVIQKKNSEILSVEHLLSAFHGLGLDSIIVEIKGGNQVPALDSSADFFTKRIVQTGLKKIDKGRKVLKVNQKFRFKDSDGDSFAEFTPGKGLEIDAEIDFNNLIGIQRYSSKITPSLFLKNICWGRTFIRSPLDGSGDKWQRIRKLIPILPEDPQQSPVLVFSNEGFITKLIRKDEPVRHKIVDFLGDLALLGYRVEGKIKLYKPGHYFNHKLIKFLDSNIKNEGKRFKIT